MKHINDIVFGVLVLEKPAASVFNFFALKMEAAGFFKCLCPSTRLHTVTL
jgi:hypothetical protein